MCCPNWEIHILRSSDVMNDGWWVVCGVAGSIVLLNIGLLLSALRNRNFKLKPLISVDLKKLVNPWLEEDRSLDELHQKVAKLSGENDETNAE